MISTDLIAIAKRIEALAKEKYGNTNKMVEASEGVLHGSIIYNMKREKASAPNIVVFQKIADLLETTTDYLLTGKENRVMPYNNHRGDSMETINCYNINIMWDDEAYVWIAISDDIPLALESGSYDALIEKVKIAASEIIELNYGRITPANLLFKSERLVANG